MDITIHHDINDVSIEVKKEVEEMLTTCFNAKIDAFFTSFRAEVKTFEEDLFKILEIKDNRKRERVRKAIANNLDKWTKGAKL